MNNDDSVLVRDAALSSISGITCDIRDAIDRLAIYAVAYKLVPFRDGNQWCVLLGEDLQSGIAGFGDTPAKAMTDFERAMHTPIAAPAGKDGE